MALPNSIEQGQFVLPGSGSDVNSEASGAFDEGGTFDGGVDIDTQPSTPQVYTLSRAFVPVGGEYIILDLSDTDPSRTGQLSETWTSVDGNQVTFFADATEIEVSRFDILRQPGLTGVRQSGVDLNSRTVRIIAHLATRVTASQVVSATATSNPAILGTVNTTLPQAFRVRNFSNVDSNGLPDYQLRVGAGNIAGVTSSGWDPINSNKCIFAYFPTSNINNGTNVTTLEDQKGSNDLILNSPGVSAKKVDNAYNGQPAFWLSKNNFSNYGYVQNINSTNTPLGGSGSVTVMFVCEGDVAWDFGAVPGQFNTATDHFIAGVYSSDTADSQQRGLVDLFVNSGFSPKQQFYRGKDRRLSIKTLQFEGADDYSPLETTFHYRGGGGSPVVTFDRTVDLGVQPDGNMAFGFDGVTLAAMYGFRGRMTSEEIERFSFFLDNKYQTEAKRFYLNPETQVASQNRNGEEATPWKTFSEIPENALLGGSGDQIVIQSGTSLGGQDPIWFVGEKFYALTANQAGSNAPLGYNIGYSPEYPFFIGCTDAENRPVMDFDDDRATNGPLAYESSHYIRLTSQKANFATANLILTCPKRDAGGVSFAGVNLTGNAVSTFRGLNSAGIVKEDRRIGAGNTDRNIVFPNIFEGLQVQNTQIEHQGTGVWLRPYGGTTYGDHSNSVATAVYNCTMNNLWLTNQTFTSSSNPVVPEGHVSGVRIESGSFALIKANRFHQIGKTSVELYSGVTGVTGVYEDATRGVTVSESLSGQAGNSRPVVMLVSSVTAGVTEVKTYVNESPSTIGKYFVLQTEAIDESVPDLVIDQVGLVTPNSWSNTAVWIGRGSRVDSQNALYGGAIIAENIITDTGGGVFCSMPSLIENNVVQDAIIGINISTDLNMIVQNNAIIQTDDYVGDEQAAQSDETNELQASSNEAYGRLVQKPHYDAMAGRNSVGIQIREDYLPTATETMQIRNNILASIREDASQKFVSVPDNGATFGLNSGFLVYPGNINIRNNTVYGWASSQLTTINADTSLEVSGLDVVLNIFETGPVSAATDRSNWAQIVSNSTLDPDGDDAENRNSISPSAIDVERNHFDTTDGGFDIRINQTVQRWANNQYATNVSQTDIFGGVEFVGPTRSVQAYADEFYGVTTLNSFYGSVSRSSGISGATGSAGSVNDWIRNGFVPTNLQKANYSGSFVGALDFDDGVVTGSSFASQYSSPTVIVGTIGGLF